MATDHENKEEVSACGCGCVGGSCCSGPGKWIWIGLVGALLGIAIAKIAMKKPVASTTPVAIEATGAPAVLMPAGQGTAIPRMVDLGATKCIPCKLMAPILADLKKTYAGRMEVQFIDVWEKPEEGPKYGIKLIPTQIFYDATGKELYRHEGFFGKEDILAKWKEFGVDLSL
jgi:thioredoxin 1